VNGPAARWLRNYRPTPDATLRLVCFPHGGGGATFFRPWALTAPEDVEVLVVQYPGREDRRGEAVLTEMSALADSAAQAIADGVPGPLALFGHSMGALVAFEVARRLEVGASQPQRLIVSGREAPHRARPSAKHLLDDAQLWADVGRLGGTHATLLESDELRALVLPTLRADFRLVAEYRVAARTPLQTGISAFTGIADPDVEIPRVESWRDWTSGGFELRSFPGDHFYLAPERRAVLRAALDAAAGDLPRVPAAAAWSTATEAPGPRQWPSTP
jgi:pyochelin biosynthetic protein PchC